MIVLWKYIAFHPGYAQTFENSGEVVCICHQNDNGELIKLIRENEWSTKKRAAAALSPTSQRPDTDGRFHRDVVSTQDIWEEYDRDHKGIAILYIN